MSENPSIAISEPSVQSQAAPSTRKPRPSKRKSGGSAALPAAGTADTNGPSEAPKGKRSVKSGKQPRAQRLTQRAVFEPFCDEKTLESGLQAGTLFQGPLCVVARQLAVISVNLPSSTAIEPAILHLRIVGQADRNRALHGDMVTVELLAQPSVTMGLQVTRNLPFTLSEPPVYARVVHVRSVIYSSAQPFADSAMHPATPSPDKLTAVAAGVPVTRAPLISGHFDLRAAKAAGDHSVIDQPLIKFIPDRVEYPIFLVPRSDFPDLTLQTVFSARPAAHSSLMKQLQFTVHLTHWPASSKHPLATVHPSASHQPTLAAEGPLITALRKAVAAQLQAKLAASSAVAAAPAGSTPAGTTVSGSTTPTSSTQVTPVAPGGSLSRKQQRVSRHKVDDEVKINTADTVAAAASLAPAVSDPSTALKPRQRKVVKKAALAVPEPATPNQSQSVAAAASSDPSAAAVAAKPKRKVVKRKDLQPAPSADSSIAAASSVTAAAGAGVAAAVQDDVKVAATPSRRSKRQQAVNADSSASVTAPSTPGVPTAASASARVSQTPGPGRKRQQVDQKAHSATPGPPSRARSDRSSATPGRAGGRPVRTLFPEHMPLAEVMNGLQSGTLFKGLMRVNAKNPRQAYITVHHHELDAPASVDAPNGGDDIKSSVAAAPAKLYQHQDGAGNDIDIYIDGQVDRNRAYEGDIVAVQLLPPDQWRTVESKEALKKREHADERRKRASERVDPDDSDADSASDDAEPDPKLQIDPFNPLTSDATAAAGSDAPNGPLMQPVGRVVAILKANRALDAVNGYLQLGKPTDKAATFVPLDKRLPFAFLASREWPAEYLQDLELQQQRQLEAETRAVTTAMAAASIAAGVPMGAAPTIATSSMATSAASDVSTSASGQSKTPQRNKKQRGKKAKSADDEGQWPSGPVTLYTVRYDTWRSSSRNPWCHVIKRVGLSGDLHAETEALLTQFDVDYDHDGAFSTEILQYVDRLLTSDGTAAGRSKDRIDPNTGTCWSIPPEELNPSRRRDLRRCRIFPIDPTTARDLDDALSIWPTASGHYRVGVHIADVSYFVRSNSVLDKEAEHRATTIYLVHKAIPMLPPILCEQLCSLNPNVDRLAFSVFFTMTSDGLVLEDTAPDGSALAPEDRPWYGRTIIRCCARLDYDCAQRMIDLHRDSTAAGTVVPIDTLAAAIPTRAVPLPASGHTLQNIVDDVVLLNNIAIERRKRRFAAGSVSLQRVKLQFDLDKEGLPTGFHSYVQKDTNRLVEEYMLLANQMVARRLVVFCAQYALLRRHAPPKHKGVNALLDTCALHDISLDMTSSRSLHRSLQQLHRSGAKRGTSGDAGFLLNQVLETLITKPMQPAVYFCTGDVPNVEDWRHYALCFDAYTHFTSPIRRYSDVVVHRLLEYSIQLEAYQRHELSSKAPAGPSGAMVTSFLRTASGVEAPLNPISGAQPAVVYDRRTVSIVAEQCNRRKLNAKRAQEQSDRVYLCALLRSKPLVEPAVVIDMGERSIDVLIPRLGVEKRIFLEDINNGADGLVRGKVCPAGAAKAAGLKMLKLQWKAGTYTLPRAAAPLSAVEAENKSPSADVVSIEVPRALTQDVHAFDVIHVLLGSSSKPPVDITAAIVHPTLIRGPTTAPVNGAAAVVNIQSAEDEDDVDMDAGRDDV